MKLEKREITLNERDSLKDVYYVEEALSHAYGAGVKGGHRKEVNDAFALLHAQAEEEKKLLCSLLEKSRENDF